MYINHGHPARLLTNYLKASPEQFDSCITELARLFVKELGLSTAKEDTAKLSIIYKFIFMYSMITSNFSTVRNIMRSSVAITTIVNALIINGNLKLRQNLQLVYIMLAFGKRNYTTLTSHNDIVNCCLRFDANIFYKVIKYLANKYNNGICIQERLIRKES